MKDIVKKYISNHLLVHLENQEISNEQIQIITKDVSLRLRSLLACWHDKDYITPLFEIVKEEATFYEPRCNIHIRSLIVMGIRNSAIEDVHSTNPFNQFLKVPKGHPIQSSAFLRGVTTDAITFFKKNLKQRDNFTSIYENILFKGLNETYPRAWKLLESMRSKKTIHSFKVPSGIPVILEQVNSFQSNEVKIVGAELSGINPYLDDGLLNQLKHVSRSTNDSIFLTPSFKHISRDIEKVMKVLDFLVYVDVPILTPNYFCTSQKVSVRKQLLKPIHSNHELKKVLTNTFGLEKEHARLLKDTAKYLD